MKIHKGVLLKVHLKDIQDGIFVVPSNVTKIGEKCFEGSSIKEITIPGSVKEIGNKAFSKSVNLEKVVLGDGLEKIGENAFYSCTKLQYINFPDSLKKIGDHAFGSCNSLDEVCLPKGLESLGAKSFAECSKLKTVIINSPLYRLENGTFEYCSSLKKVSLSDEIREINDDCFFKCYNLEKMNWPNKLQIIGKNAFLECGLKSVVLPKCIRSIHNSAFFQCGDLSYVKIPSSITEIEKSVFSRCVNLMTVDLPDTITAIGEGAFSYCARLNKIKLPNNLKKIGNEAFLGCKSLFGIDIPGSVETLGKYSFSDCLLGRVGFNEGLKVIGEFAFSSSRITKVEFPDSLEEIRDGAFRDGWINRVVLGKNVKVLGNMAFSNVIELSTYDYPGITLKGLNLMGDLTIIDPASEEKVIISSKDIIRIASSNGIIVETSKGIGFFDCNNKWIVVNKNLFKNHGLNDFEQFKKYYKWISKNKFLPKISIMNNMPISEIDNFYINDNDKRWKNLLETGKISTIYGVEGFFKLAYSLGVFDKSAKVSKQACDFIKTYIFKYMKETQYFPRFGDMHVSEVGYNSEFAKLVFKYYPIENTEFLMYKGNMGPMRDCFSMVYNNFNLISKKHYNKQVNTNTKKNMLTPQLCMDANYNVYKRYCNIKPGNEALASNLSMYGYGQEIFNEVQEAMEKGKSIPKEELTPQVDLDYRQSGLVYKLLDKDDPIAPIIGNLTNNCQTATGLAKKCVFHGLSERNSGFITFSKDEFIVAQSWVWYDEKQKRICLDNIEITKSVIKNKIKALYWKNEMINCLKRLSNSMVEKMKESGHEVDTITVGEGYNDMGKLLNLYFKKIENQPPLTGYNGYSDAKNQYVIYSKKT